MILIFDNYDSFTYNLVDIFLQKSIEVKVLRNDEVLLSDIIAMQPKAIVISPGPGRPEQSGILMQLIAYFSDKIPLLGICLGHQAIALHFGSTLVQAQKCMHGKVSKIYLTNHPMFANIGQATEMMRYHSLIINNLAACLQATAYTEEQELMAFTHSDLPIWAVQFHPESVMSIEGPNIIKNWLTHFQLDK